MRSARSFKALLLPALYLFVNILFIAKYVSRASVCVAVVTSVLYAAVMAVVFMHARWLSSKVSPRVTIAVFVVYLVLLAILQYSTDPYQLRVDRWSAIHNFLSYLFQGKYPYLAPTHLGGYGSPFPVWQVVHIPFYLLRDVGLSLMVSLAVLVYVVRKYASSQSAVMTIVLFMLSPAVLYEAAVRSDLLTNFIVSAIIVLVFFHHRVTLRRHFFLVSLLCGLMMSTRLTAVLPLGVYILCDWWRQRPAGKVAFPLVVVAVFALTFLPFVLWDSHDLLFFRYNPFVLQSRQIHPSDIFPVVLLFIVAGIYWTKAPDRRSRLRRLLAATALLLFVSVVIVFGHNMVAWDNYRLFSPTYDITYFDMSLPFCILAMSIGSERRNRG